MSEPTDRMNSTQRLLVTIATRWPNSTNVRAAREHGVDMHALETASAREAGDE